MKIEIQEPAFNTLVAFKNLTIHHQLTVPELVEKVITRGEGKLADSGALAVDTGFFTGRSPKDRFIVEDELTKNLVWWGDVNIRFNSFHFDQLYDKMIQYLEAKEEIFSRKALACADENYQIGITVVTETAYQNLFAHHLFLRPQQQTEAKLLEEWTIIAAPGFKANPAIDGTRQANFSIINFSKRMILIGGTGYTGEIKKGIFSVLNFLMPINYGVLPMHCSANVGKQGDTAIFFGLSGTGKTTLSADPNRALIGDDEHGWSEHEIFNFEGGCYAKCIDLSQEKEPEIFEAIKFGALLENINFIQDTRTVDFHDIQKTENTRVAYPIYYIKNAISPSKSETPKNIFFLTADAFGVLPPIAKLTMEQAMYHFVSGYTAKVAGTEAGVNEPQATFSACFGKAFLPLHPFTYAKLLGEKIEKGKVNVWLVNTGWTGGPYGVGSRIKLSYTRRMINAALLGELNDVEYVKHEIFNLEIPFNCKDVPNELLNPINNWINKNDYIEKAKELALLFDKNYKQFADRSLE
ncbi:MAG: phosphoenolpyruvate carboxykinase (ATP) [Pelobium sp.]